MNTSRVEGTSHLEVLDSLCREHGLLVIYLFGSRADDGLRLLHGEKMLGEGGNLQVGISLLDPFSDVPLPEAVQPILAEIFSPLQIEVVSLQELGGLERLAIIEGHLVAERDSTAAAKYEIVTMSMAAEELWWKEKYESDDPVFGLR